MEIRIIKSAKKKKSHYTQVLNEIAQSNKLTLEERGLLLYFLSLPEDWKINKVRLHKTLNVGRDKLNSIWKGLVEKGYIQTKYRNENGKFTYEHYVYEIPPFTENPSSVIDLPFTENPSSVIDLPITEKPLTVEPYTENPSTYKQKETNKIEETNILELDILELDTSKENLVNEKKQDDIIVNISTMMKNLEFSIGNEILFDLIQTKSHNEIEKRIGRKLSIDELVYLRKIEKLILELEKFVI
jgi:hypothetical protein